MSDQENTPETDPPPAGSGKRRPPPAPDTAGNTDPQGRPSPQDAPAEPEIVSAGDLELGEPELESPAISAEAAEAASLDTAAAEAAAVEADAAEAGRLAAPGQPAPAGTEIPDNAGGEAPGTAGGEAPGTAGGKTPTPEPQPEQQPQSQPSDAPTVPGNGPAAASGGATAVSGDTHSVPEHTVPEHAAPAASEDPTAAGPDGTASAVPKDPAPATGKPEAPNRNLRILIAVGAVGIIAVLLVLLFTLLFDTKEDGVLSEDVEPVELEQGACIQDFEDINSEVDVVTCETPHNSQLVATAEVEDADTYPGSEALAARVDEVCNAVQYSDAAAALPDIRLEKAIPTEESWRQGDRRVDCFVVSPQDLTQSLLR